jgi:hypothetical protein
MNETLFFAAYVRIAELAARSGIGLCQDIHTLQLRLVHPPTRTKAWTLEERYRHDQLLERVEAYNIAHSLLAPETLRANSLIA